MSSRNPEKTGAEGDEIEVRFSIRQIIVAIAVIGVALGLIVQVPFLVVTGLDAVLLGFAFFKIVRLPRGRSILVTVIVFVILGVILGLLRQALSG